MKGLLTMVLTGKCWVMLPGHHEQLLTILSLKTGYGFLVAKQEERTVGLATSGR